jgi:hypothetical protein
MLAACARRNSRQLGPERLGAGPRSAHASSRRTVLGETREAELVELAGEPLVAPARVLARQPQHKLARSGVDRRAPWPRARASPSPPHKLAVPTQQRLRRDEQAMAARGRQQPACCGQHRAVTRSQLRTFDLTTQNVQLMAQQEQLDVPDVNASAAAKQQLQQRHEDQIDERQDHRAILSGTPATPAFQGRPAFWHPSGRIAITGAPGRGTTATGVVPWPPRAV